MLSKNQSVAIANLLRKKCDNNNPVAVYKYENNELHTYSAIYTQLVCTVTWDPVEKSFDCPCHDFLRQWEPQPQSRSQC